ncbi:CaiB/BaiF CoA transferase family protein [Alteribacillus bidgolensis]|uniref:Crotonobetainyl-CoA:carnitine CoA-transferase CaiB n=1 Tax=Alteribacillus bidgolensis TaxID=930129 RepID=A0A1G8KGU7_9BACI|nr:CaiB/BaiF CoA-transferase family protein [Alteribacillus bidgolensis]SDI42683.1 Crotonobetainyl-CoA:carnitine CoA-transferase CaiB [Alteribacillus bidgolensis]
MNQPLAGIKILDLSRVLAGPLGSMQLADLGAEVIRIEAPEGKDDIRHWWPFVNEESTYYLCANRNKKSVTINLKKEEGKALFKKMAAEADVIIENFKTGTLERLGLDYNTLKSLKEDIILCSVTGYGQTGPYKDLPGYDPVIQAVGGLMDITGHPDSEETRVGTPVVDIMTSHYVAISILAALRKRDVSGEGERIDLSLLDIQVASLGNIASSYLLTGHISKRMGNAHGNITPYETFQCADKPIMVAAGNDRMFYKLAEIMERGEWKEDARFKTNADRIKNREQLRNLLEAEFLKKDADQWEELLSSAMIPCGPVNNVEQVFNHPQIKAREMVQKRRHPTLGEIKTVRNPIKFTNTKVEEKSHPPILGEHTVDILMDYGLSENEIKELKENGVI